MKNLLKKLENMSEGKMLTIVIVMVAITIVAFLMSVAAMGIIDSVTDENKNLNKNIIREKNETIVEKVNENKSNCTYIISDEDRETLARLVFLEARGESIECQRAIVSVVINRWIDGTWGDTLEEVVFAPYQFTPAYLIPDTTPTETQYEVVDYVLQNGCTVPEYVMYFRADHHFENWYDDGYEPYEVYDHTYFGYFTKDK